MRSFSEHLNLPRKRRVFFSFHYDDIWRVNQIRNSWRFGSENTREGTGFFDASLWEQTRRESPASLKQLIRDGLDQTSVTCVLAGFATYERRWVRYEIARSLTRGNGLLVVDLLQAKRSGLLGISIPELSPRAENPLEYMGVVNEGNGKVRLVEKPTGLLRRAEWLPYEDYQQAFSLPKGWITPPPGMHLPLSVYCDTYRYEEDNGHQHFNCWVDGAARQVSRL